MEQLFKNYTVTTSGEVINNTTNKSLIGDTNNCGYARVQIGRKHYYRHRLVAMTHLPNPLDLEQVNHKDGNKLNNDVDNLEWVTASENQIHRREVLKDTSGNRKYTREFVDSVREMLRNGVSGRALARRFGVPQSWIQAVRHNKIW